MKTALFLTFLSIALPAHLLPRRPAEAKGTQRTAADLLDCSISYHDPKGAWSHGAFEITDVSRRPDGKIGRTTVLRVDNPRGRSALEMHVDGHVISAAFQGDTVTDVRLDGHSSFSDEEVQRFQLAGTQILSRRNFFLYLLGLPMKLRDPGTKLDPEVKVTLFEGRPVHQLRVTYDQSIGTDTWYFYVDPRTCRLVGHRYYHDEALADGEFAILTEEVKGEGLRLPGVREWHRNRDGEWFITHTIQSITAPRHTRQNPP